MVDWPGAFGQLSAAEFTGSSLHIEYKPPDVRATVAREFTVLKKPAETAYSKEKS
jgi:hypothetical protein